MELDIREILLISGAAAFGGTLVAAAFGAAILFSRRCTRSSTLSCNFCHASCNGARDRASSASGEPLRRPRHHQAFVFHHPSRLISQEEEEVIDEPCCSQRDLTRPLLGTSRNSEGEWSTSHENSSREIVEDVGNMVTDGVEEPVLLESFCFPKTFKPDPLGQAKRKGYLSWDDYFMSIAFLSAQRSKDPNRQVGACLVSQDQVIFGIGYNGFPRGCSDDDLPWSKLSADGDPLKTKYPYVCHAEVNAILNKNHASAAGQKLYVTMFPCNECAKIIIQAGIVEVIYYTAKGHSGKDGSFRDPVYAASWKLLAMAGVKVRQHQPAVNCIVLHFK